MSKDNRAGKLADLVLNYSVDIKESDRLIIQFDPAYSEYGTMIGKKAMARGVDIRYDPLTFDPVLLRGLIARRDKVEWKHELERRKDLARWCSARILIENQSNPNYAQGIKNSAEIVSEFSKEVIGPYKKVLYRAGDNNGCEVKWNIVGFPTRKDAKVANMSFSDYADFVYNATLNNDWIKMGQSMKKMKKVFDYAEDVRIVVPGLTDLHLSLKDRASEICDGKCNMPDGEFFYGPRENSANGHIYFNCPTQREGMGIVEGIRLELIDGLITNFSANKNQKDLEATLNTDEGSRRIGELGIGCNYGIQRSILSTLFDEKIGGSIHLAVGDSLNNGQLNNGGGLNKSGVHWDIVCDLRRNPKNIREF
ncbi:MAG: aminopeptidase, partial [archaeon]